MILRNQSGQGWPTPHIVWLHNSELLSNTKAKTQVVANINININIDSIVLDTTHQVHNRELLSNTNAKTLVVANINININININKRKPFPK